MTVRFLRSFHPVLVWSRLAQNSVSRKTARNGLFTLGRRSDKLWAALPYSVQHTDRSFAAVNRLRSVLHLYLARVDHRNHVPIWT